MYDLGKTYHPFNLQQYVAAAARATLLLCSSIRRPEMQQLRLQIMQQQQLTVRMKPGSISGLVQLSARTAARRMFHTPVNVWQIVDLLHLCRSGFHFIARWFKHSMPKHHYLWYQASNVSTMFGWQQRCSMRASDLKASSRPYTACPCATSSCTCLQKMPHKNGH